jgi:hypothetical protein
MHGQGRAPDDLLSADEAKGLLLGSGWNVSEVVYHAMGRGLVWIVAGSHGEDRLQAEGSSMGEAWRRAVEMAAACGKPTGCPESSPGPG